MAFTCCRDCKQFVAPSDSLCPFCGASVRHPAKVSKPLRVARSAMLAAALAAGPAAAGCSTSTTPGDAGTNSDASMADVELNSDAPDVPDAPGSDGGLADAGMMDAVLIDAALLDAALIDAALLDADEDGDIPVPPYGISPPDSGQSDAGPDAIVDAAPDVPPAPLYGAPPPDPSD